MENLGPPEQLIAVSAPGVTGAALSAGTRVLSLPEKSTSSLAADGVFLLLKGVSGDLTDGRTLPISLAFALSGTVTTRARLVAPRSEGTANEYGLFGIGDICQVDDGEPAPNIVLTAKKTEMGWQIDVGSEEFEFTPDLADGPHVPGTGHGHIYVNGLKLGRLYSSTTTIGHLPSGQHEIRVTLSTNDHRAYVVDNRPVTASIRIHSD